MPEISMCTNEKCDLKQNCYRYRAIPKHYDQKYGDFHPMGDGTCPDFWDCSEYVQRNLTPIKKHGDGWFFSGSD